LGARAAYAAAALTPARIISLLCLATPYVMFEGKGESPAQARAFWYQWYFNLDRGRDAFAADPKSFCEYLWRVWSPRWEFSAAEFAATSAAWSNPQFVDVVIHYYRHRYGNASGSGVYTAQQATLDAQPVIRVPTVFACGTADACNLPESSLDQERWFANGYERVEVEGPGTSSNGRIQDSSQLCCSVKLYRTSSVGSNGTSTASRIVASPRHFLVPPATICALTCNNNF
jgi:pimeloyl-ACP methyl ester carboxylesterase